MRAKKPFIIASFLCTWSIISYYLLIRQTTNPSRLDSASSDDMFGSRRQEILQKLSYLEENIKRESQLHDQLIQRLVNVVRVSNDVPLPPPPPEQQKQQFHQQQPVPQPNQNDIHSGNNNKPAKAVGYVERLDGYKYEANNVIDNNVAIQEIPLLNKNNINTNNDNDDDINRNDIDGNNNNNNKQNDISLTARIQQTRKNQHQFRGPVIPVLVFACNRISVRKCLDNLIEYRPNADQFPIIVSQVNTFSLFVVFNVCSLRIVLHLETQPFQISSSFR